MTTPYHIMTKPAGSACNLDCTYCFYLEKEKLYDRGATTRMRDDVLERYVRQYIESQDAPEVTFAWQGGEPTLMGLAYYRKAVELQKQYAGGRRINNSLQTNGTLLDDEWGDFLGENGFLVGVSIDGPRELHDHYRVDKRSRPTFDSVMRGIETLQRNKVEFNTLTVVNRHNSDHPLEVYRFLKEIGSTFLQFIPIVERLPERAPAKDGLIQLSLASPPRDGQRRLDVTEWSVGPSKYGEFLVAIFDEWVKRDVGATFVQIFDVSLGAWMGLPAGLCVHAPTCGRGLAMEHNGDVYACDHYVYPEFHVGNVMDAELAAIVDGDAMRKFGADKLDLLPQDCIECDVRFACNGDCPKHRFRRSASGKRDLSYLCPSFKRFFTHIDPYMRIMADLVRSGRPAAQIMRMRPPAE
ncbi:MAG: anaerobic sulfatase maturase [Capsulimonadaceae bacterium]|nr:anaerobic sulfatase maturase [Capsulimonadaceae bacterium]